MIEAFVEFVDGIYFSGYAKHMANEEPERFNFELNEFLNNYGLGLERS